MNTTQTNRIVRVIDRAKEIWAELDYAQRRVVEITTGVPLGAEHPRVRTRVK